MRQRMLKKNLCIMSKSLMCNNLDNMLLPGRMTVLFHVIDVVRVVIMLIDVDVVVKTIEELSMCARECPNPVLKMKIFKMKVRNILWESWGRVPRSLATGLKMSS
uniref:Uncharacterized protein n=1 Tax=Cacopsylla melanoneura TaxID=428564 RepID=A0A8D8XRI5_9HEMI